MMQDQLFNHLQTCVSAYARACALSEGRVWRLSMQDDKFAKRVQAGGSFTVANYDRGMNWFHRNWPIHLKWPSDVPLPVPPDAGRAQMRGAIHA